MESSKKFSISNLLINILFVVFCIFFVFVLGNIFINKYGFIKINYFQYAITLFIFIALYYVLDKFNEKLFKSKVINVILLALYLAFQIWFLNKFRVEPTWDFGYIYDIADRFARNESILRNEVYLYTCDNNIPLVLFEGYFMKLLYKLGQTDTMLSGEILNLLCIDVCLWFLYKTLKEVNKEHSKLFFFLCLFIAPFITYLPVFYTDTLSMPFVSFSIYYLYKFFFKKASTLEMVLCGLSMGVGGVLKPTALIPLIATIIFMFLKTNKKPKQYVITALILIVFSLLPTFANSLYKKTYFDQYKLYDERLVLDHYIMIGMNKEHNGAYSDELFNFTNNIKGEDNKKKYIDEVIGWRINEMLETHTVFSFYNVKNSFTWTNGTFYGHELLGTQHNENALLKYLNDSDYNDVYWAICNVEWTLIIALMILGCMFKKYLPSDMYEFKVLLDISIFGLILFLFLWEASPRYIYNFFPIFIVDAYIGINSIRNFINQKMITQ